MPSQHIRDHLLLVVAACAVLFFRLGDTYLWDRDEPRNARCAQEMMERDDWITPTFNGELRAHKPVLLYWLMRSSYRLFGVNEFGARFTSAALSLGTVLVTYHLGRRIFSSKAGFWAGLALATCPLFVTSARAATPDATLIFFMTSAILAYVIATFPPSGESSPATIAQRKLSIWTYLLLGMAILAKGPVGLVLPLVTMTLHGWLLHLKPPPQAESWRQTIARWREIFARTPLLEAILRLRLPLGIAAAVLIAAPWYVAVGYATDGEFLREFFGEHNLGRALSAKEGHRGFGPPYYLGVILGGTFPWSVLAAPLLLDVYRNLKTQREDRGGLLLAITWIGSYLIVFSVARTKLPSYVTPCYPAAALLVGLFIDRCQRAAVLVSYRWLAAAMIALAIVGSLMGGGVAWAATRYAPAELWASLLGVLIGLCGIAGLLGLYRDSSRVAIASLVTSAFVLALGVHGLLLPRISANQSAARMLHEAHLVDAGQSQWVAMTGLEPSWLFYSQQSIAERPIYDANRRNPRLEMVNELLAGPRPTIVLITTEDLVHLRAQLASHVAILSEAPLLFRRDRLVLLGSQETALRLAAANQNLRR